VKKNCHELAQVLACPFQATVIKYEDGKENVRTVCYSAVSVKLAGRDERLVAVVVKGFGTDPLMLLTHFTVSLQQKESLWRIVEIYLTRWKCDESLR
jgi:hypothetical protein